ncbi:hypothetical protein [Neisseria perflava]|uniref:hypothetical protein n=1 Tax=Neisseria perflava TaxID=33053 RepID=UPI00209C8824|nr:hypothetical protein [Neisseria perflava]MCP1659102.1 DNA repair exonuclease SbcCD ATPase subunit [Neisseria perflava]MCP1771401.1 DNA repair exonuclease SbcCD ATPase subunit [Neisseria perflava]
MNFYNEHDLSELEEDSHKYSIINIEDLKRQEDDYEDSFLDEWEADEIIIEELERKKEKSEKTKKIEEIERCLKEAKEMHAKIRRLRDKALKDQKEAEFLKKCYENNNKEAQAKAREIISLREQVRLLQKELGSNQELAELKADNARLYLENKTLRKTVNTERKKNEALSKSEIIRSGKSRWRRLEQAAINAAKAEKEVRETITIRAKKAGKAKKSPYEKAGTTAAVFALLEEKVDMLEHRGGKAALNQMILDLIATNKIPAPSMPSSKTVDSWIDEFKKQKSSS